MVDRLRDQSSIELRALVKGVHLPPVSPVIDQASVSIGRGHAKAAPARFLSRTSDAAARLPDTQDRSFWPIVLSAA